MNNQSSFVPSVVDKYIPLNIILLANSTPTQEAPQLLVQNESCRWYHLKETAFQLPQQMIGFSILSNSTYSTVQYQMLTDLLVSLYRNMLEESFYFMSDTRLYNIWV